MNSILKSILLKAKKLCAFDVHVKTAFSPLTRIGSEIRKMDFQSISPAEMENIVLSILDERQRSEFRAKGQIDTSFSMPEVGRIRCNIFYQRNSLAMSMRLVPILPPEMQVLGFPQEVINSFLLIKRGMILITGATNSGKSTTAASMVRLLAEKSSYHIITIEDPVEYVFPDYPTTIISQRQLGEDTLTFNQALNSALRQDPDVVFIGELRDQETVETCLKASETGHLVIATLHTANAVQSILRMINIFPSYQRDNIRFMLSSSLKMVISQVLIPTATKKGRIMAYELLPIIPSVANLIRQKKIHEISSLMRISQKAGCIPMSNTVKQLLKSKQITREDIPQDLYEELK